MASIYKAVRAGSHPSSHICLRICAWRGLHSSAKVIETSADQPPTGLQGEAYHGRTAGALRRHFNHFTIMPNIGIMDVLRAKHPNCTVTRVRTRAGLLELAHSGKAQATPSIDDDFHALREYVHDKDDQKRHGMLKDDVELGRYKYQWSGRDFLVYEVSFWYSDVPVANHYIIYPRIEGDVVAGRSRTVDELIKAAAQNESEITNEIWVYDRGYWRKSNKLWESVQGCRWENVILSPEIKENLINDIEGFFDRKKDYQSFAVPWKRGLIFHGLPGNGKTVSIKALMRSLASRPTPVPTLYVKSLGSTSDHEDISSIFDKARKASPCLLVLEDIDSLVSDNVKSFFLNEVDGLEGNDGILMIGSTNYLDRLDAGISKRPSRFDRKYHFALPTLSDRIQYCEHWRSKLHKATANHRIPAELSPAMASITEGFSFAYLQEAFVTALLEILQQKPLSAQASQCIEPNRPGVDGLSTLLDPTHDSSGLDSSPSDSQTSTSPPETDLSTNKIWQALQKQVNALRKELKDGKKSAEDAAQNSMLKDPKSGSASSTGFGLGS